MPLFGLKQILPGIRWLVKVKMVVLRLYRRRVVRPLWAGATLVLMAQRFEYCWRAFRLRCLPQVEFLLALVGFLCGRWWVFLARPFAG